MMFRMFRMFLFVRPLILPTKTRSGEFLFRPSGGRGLPAKLQVVSSDFKIKVIYFVLTHVHLEYTIKRAMKNTFNQPEKF